MNKTTKKYVARAGIVAGVGVGAFLGAQTMETENPLKEPIETVAKMAVIGGVGYSGLLGVATLQTRARRLEAEHDHKEAEKIKEGLPKIETTKNPYIFSRYLEIFEPNSIKPNSKANQMIRPLIRSYERSNLSHSEAYKMTILSRTVDNLRGTINNIRDTQANYPDLTQVYDAAWFLDQTFPIADDCKVTPVDETGEKKWFNYIEATLQQQPQD